MPIPRVHLFELEDQPWFPATVRDLATDYLRFIETRFGLHRAVLQPLGDALRTTRETHVIDLCSGGGGPIVSLHRALNDQGLGVTFTLTDRFPNIAAFQEAVAAAGGAIDFVAEPVDARAVPESLKGFRTLFNAFHHFRPEIAQDVLKDAARSGQPIGVFEVSNRGFYTLASMLLLTALMVLLGTPFIRPFRWRRLFWTYVIPAVPVTCWWDGVVSQLRAYKPAELAALAHGVGGDAYSWTAGRVPIQSTPASMTYLLGVPRSNRDSRLATGGSLSGMRDAGSDGSD
jgi:hypothetical protein